MGSHLHESSPVSGFFVIVVVVVECKRSRQGIGEQIRQIVFFLVFALFHIRSWWNSLASYSICCNFVILKEQSNLWTLNSNGNSRNQYRICMNIYGYIRKVKLFAMLPHFPFLFFVFFFILADSVDVDVYCSNKCIETVYISHNSSIVHTLYVYMYVWMLAWLMSLKTLRFMLFGRQQQQQKISIYLIQSLAIFIKHTQHLGKWLKLRTWIRCCLLNRLSLCLCAAFILPLSFTRFHSDSLIVNDS